MWYIFKRALFLAGLTTQGDEGGGRILLGDNRCSATVTMRPIGFQWANSQGFNCTVSILSCDLRCTLGTYLLHKSGRICTESIAKRTAQIQQVWYGPNICHHSYFSIPYSDIHKAMTTHLSMALTWAGPKPFATPRVAWALRSHKQPPSYDCTLTV